MRRHLLRALVLEKKHIFAIKRMLDEEPAFVFVASALTLIERCRLGQESCDPLFCLRLDDLGLLWAKREPFKIIKSWTRSKTLYFFNSATRNQWDTRYKFSTSKPSELSTYSMNPTETRLHLINTNFMNSVPATVRIWGELYIHSSLLFQF